MLPFVNLSGDPEQEYFSEGMVDEIITALLWLRWLYVAARTSSSMFKGGAGDVREIGRRLGVRYVLEGSVRRSGERVRIIGQLIDAATGDHLWPIVSTAAWRIYSIFRTESRKASSAQSNQNWS